MCADVPVRAAVRPWTMTSSEAGLAACSVRDQESVADQALSVLILIRAGIEVVGFGRAAAALKQSIHGDLNLLATANFRIALGRGAFDIPPLAPL